jgi:LAO/AO transport system kinase
MDPNRRRELAQLISRIDRLTPADPLPLPEDGKPLGTAFRLGITGPLGAGKSTLINQVARIYRQRGYSVGIIAVDPTSPFTGGALLGDRVRMSDLALDDGVFIRSLATRGAVGGMATATVDAADLLDAYGFDRIILETVGVGQSDIAIAGASDLTCVILEPGAGDSIQALKAGLMEIADLFIVNKKDMRGADRFILDLATVLEMKPDATRPEILAASANRGDGVPEMVDWLESYFRRVSDNGKLETRRAGQRVERIRYLANEAAVQQLWEMLSDQSLLRVVNSKMSAREAARLLVEEFLTG